MEKIRHIVVVWDECEHVSKKCLDEVSDVFWKNYVDRFPEGAKTVESPIVIATGSPILAGLKLETFLHEGGFVPHEGENKDLALVKYCSTGLIDQHGRFFFLLDWLRNERYRNGDTPLSADESVLVCFVTSDWRKGMSDALAYVQRPKQGLKTNFASLKVSKMPSPNMERIALVGKAVGTELQRCFVGLEDDVLVLDLKRPRNS